MDEKGFIALKKAELCYCSAADSLNSRVSQLKNQISWNKPASERQILKDQENLLDISEHLEEAAYQLVRDHIRSSDRIQWCASIKDNDPMIIMAKARQELHNLYQQEGALADPAHVYDELMIDLPDLSDDQQEMVNRAWKAFQNRSSVVKNFSKMRQIVQEVKEMRDLAVEADRQENNRYALAKWLSPGETYEEGLERRLSSISSQIAYLQNTLLPSMLRIEEVLWENAIVEGSSYEEQYMALHSLIPAMAKDYRSVLETLEEVMTADFIGNQFSEADFRSMRGEVYRLESKSQQIQNQIQDAIESSSIKKDTSS